ncbi:MAG: protein kinase [Myxococcales bacterium]|nr:protein kinase [Myxococcales bacterium]
MTLAPGTVVGGDFRIEAPLAQGGMGAVFIATQLSTGRKRALKVMHALLVGDALSRQRFLEEARIGSEIESDHVVEVVGAGVDQDTGSPWLAMELLEGETLSDRVARGRLSPAELLPLVAGLRHGLGRAHARGIVHRDLKPENLFIARGRGAGAEESLKILDFGIAKLLQGGKTAATQNIAGSPLWMAPEQADGGAIRPATDVWALGLIAFDALVGQPYWRSAREGATLTRLLVEILTEPLEPASVRAASVAGPAAAAGLPTGFDSFFARCVARDSYARFTDANVALDALTDVLLGRPPAPQEHAAAAPHEALAATALSLPAPPPDVSTPLPLAFRATAATEPAPQPSELAATHAGTPGRSGAGVLAGVTLGLGLAGVIGAAVFFNGGDGAPQDSVAAPPLTRPVEAREASATAHDGDESADADAAAAPDSDQAAPTPAEQTADVPADAPTPESPPQPRVGAGSRSAPRPARDAPVRAQGAEAQRFRAMIIAPCWRDNAPPDAAPVNLSVILSFGAMGNISSLRIDGTSDANVRRCIVMRGTSYRLSERPTEPTLTVRARLP